MSKREMLPGFRLTENLMTNNLYDVKDDAVEVHPVMITFADNNITTFVILVGEYGEVDGRSVTVPTKAVLAESQVRFQGQTGKLLLELAAAIEAGLFVA